MKQGVEYQLFDKRIAARRGVTKGPPQFNDEFL